MVSVCRAWGYAWYVPKANAVNVGFGGRRSRLEKWDRELWDDLVALLKKEGCLTESPPQPKGYSYYMGRRRKQAKKANRLSCRRRGGIWRRWTWRKGLGRPSRAAFLAARDVCGKGNYSLRSIPRYSLPFIDRAFLPVAAMAP